MGECKLDHTIEDVRAKLEQQAPHLPDGLAQQLTLILETNTSTQAQLNEIFHLLKKYDLSSKEEQEERNVNIRAFVEACASN